MSAREKLNNGLFGTYDVNTIPANLNNITVQFEIVQGQFISKGSVLRTRGAFTMVYKYNAIGIDNVCIKI